LYIILRPHALLKVLASMRFLAGANDMRHCLLLIFLFLTSCAITKTTTNPTYIKQEAAITPLHIIPIYIDNKFCITDKALIKTAIDNWNDALNGYLILKIISTNFIESKESIKRIIKEKSFVILQTYSDNEIIKERDIDDNLTIGLANKIGGNIIHLVRDRLSEKDITPITMHELGHLLGADHTEEKYLMNYLYSKDRYKCVDLYTIRQVSEFWHLPIQRMNYCIY